MTRNYKKENNITILQLVPSLLKLLMDGSHFNTKSSLRTLFCGGEKLSPDLEKKFYEHSHQIKLINLYGPTEATIDATYWVCENKGQLHSVPIGVHLSNTQIHI